jgi:hypothetical protein
MARIFTICILAMLGFYVAWPVYSAFAIKSAVASGNADQLATKIDFDQLRSSLKPSVTLEVEKAMTAALQQGGKDNAQLLAQLKVGLMPSVVEIALATIVTPDSLLRIYQEGGDVKKTITKIVNEKMGGGALGALSGIASGKSNGGLSDIFKTIGKVTAPEVPQPAAEQQAVQPLVSTSFGIKNIKSFAMTGLASFSVGVANSAAATLPDAVIDMAFTGYDWKVVGVRPRV